MLVLAVLIGVVVVLLPGTFGGIAASAAILDLSAGYVLSDAGATAFVANTTLSAATAWGHECDPGTCIFGHGYAANASDAAVKVRGMWGSSADKKRIAWLRSLSVICVLGLAAAHELVTLNARPAPAIHHLCCCPTNATRAQQRRAHSRALALA
jgi:hypothetical protein